MHLVARDLGARQSHRRGGGGAGVSTKRCVRCSSLSCSCHTHLQLTTHCMRPSHHSCMGRSGMMLRSNHGQALASDSAALLLAVRNPLRFRHCHPFSCHRRLLPNLAPRCHFTSVAVCHPPLLLSSICLIPLSSLPASACAAQVSPADKRWHTDKVGSAACKCRSQT